MRQLLSYSIPGISTATVRVRHAVEQEIPLGVVLAVLDTPPLIPAVVLSIASIVEVNLSCTCSAMEDIQRDLRVSMVERSLISNLELCRILGRLLYEDTVVLS